MNFRAMSEPYTAADEQLLFVLNEEIRPNYCRMCYDCEGKCPKGMPVAEVLRFLAYHDFCGNSSGHGELQWSGERGSAMCVAAIVQPAPLNARMAFMSRIA